ncbi:CCA tRNA nucleotidyltransferase [Patulibacter minatonensis]|uniref:CCA tRNA nucleotidyltransferase n=1 Tax=Patulibacter minatonensis TaxID=298163 RepID=UPI0004ACDBA0|nr:CCA tRNA nucleotidyltransferase [Patulibacter minatonensis]
MAVPTPPPTTLAAAYEALRALPAAAPLLAAVRPEDDAWLVGGAVRDLLLGREPQELDVVVVGPVEPLAERLGETVARHERFGTATVRTATGVLHDLARARTETYARPGALPDVVPAATVDEDLVRRDLTVNAIALRLSDGRSAEIPGAREDLAAGVLRVLHDRSFVDDPTRVWRTARYAARLGFAVDPATAALAAEADPFAISGARHGGELRLALGEPDPAAVFRTLLALNPRFLPPGFDPEPAALPAALELLPPEGRPDLLRMAASTAGVDLRHLLPWVADTGWSTAEADVIGAGSRASTAGPLARATTPSEIHRAASGVPVEVVALAGGDNARRWFDELRHVRLTIGGHDLLAAGVPAGPAVGEGLRRALVAKLDGRLDPALPERDAELAAAGLPHADAGAVAGQETDR